jgi:hypothetical protein
MSELELSQQHQRADTKDDDDDDDDDDFVPHSTGLSTSKENQGLLRNTRPPRRSLLQSCCRACVILTSVIIFVLMLIQLWSNYGEYIENRVMAPSIAGAGEFHAEGAATQFVMKFHKWTNTTLHLNMSKPHSFILDVTPDAPYVWFDHCLRLEVPPTTTVKVFVWSM